MVLLGLVKKTGMLVASLPDVFWVGYLGSGAEPVTVKAASDLDLVSSGWVLPSVSVYLPGWMVRLPCSSTVEMERGSIFSVTVRLMPGWRVTRSKPTKE